MPAEVSRQSPIAWDNLALAEVESFARSLKVKAEEITARCLLPTVTDYTVKMALRELGTTIMAPRPPEPPLHQLLRANMEAALPRLATWIRNMEVAGCIGGLLLTEAQQVDAKAAGVRGPGAIRLVYVEALPKESGADEFELAGSGFLCVRHAIYIQKPAIASRLALATALATSAQYVRLGIEGYLRQYLSECSSVGRNASGLVLDAKRIASTIVSED